MPGTPEFRELPKICDACEREVDYVRGSMWHGDSRICRECFREWYDPDDPTTTEENATCSERIGNWVRKKHGLPPLNPIT